MSCIQKYRFCLFVHWYIYIYTVYVYIHIHEWIHTHMYTYICNACVDRCGQVGGSQPPWSGKIQLVSPTEACNRPAEKLWQFGHLFYVLKKHILRGSKQILHDQFPQQSDFSTFLSGVSMIFPCALTQETIVFFFDFFLIKDLICLFTIWGPAEGTAARQGEGGQGSCCSSPTSLTSPASCPAAHSCRTGRSSAEGWKGRGWAGQAEGGEGFLVLAASILLFLKLFDVFYTFMCFIPTQVQIKL